MMNQELTLLIHHSSFIIHHITGHSFCSVLLYPACMKSHYLNYLAVLAALCLGIMIVTACSLRPQPAKRNSVGLRPGPTQTATPTSSATVTATPLPTTTSARVALVATPTFTSRPTLASPTVTRTPTPTRTPRLEVTASPVVEKPGISLVEVYETTITLPTYPFRDYLVEQVDPVY